MKENSDDPLSIFFDAISYLFGRITLFILTILAATILGAYTAQRLGYEAEPDRAILLYPIMFSEGFTQYWGIPIYFLLILIAAVYITKELRHRWMLLVFLLQGAETVRWYLTA